MSSVDVGLRYNQDGWTDGEVHYLFNDRLFPVCSPTICAGAVAKSGLRLSGVTRSSTATIMVNGRTGRSSWPITMSMASD